MYCAVKIKQKTQRLFDKFSDFLKSLSCLWMVKFTTPTIYISIKILLQEHLREILQKKQIIFNIQKKGTIALLRKLKNENLRIKKVKTCVKSWRLIA